MEQMGKVEQCDGPDKDPNFWCNAAVIARRRDGRIRFTLDLVYANGCQETVETVLPDVKDVPSRFQGCGIFSAIDFAEFFFQFTLELDDRGFFGFRSPDGRYMRFISTPQGLTSVSGFAQECMQRIFEPIFAETLTALSTFIDDMLLGTKAIDSTGQPARLPLTPGSPEAGATGLEHLAHAAPRFRAVPPQRTAIKAGEGQIYEEHRSHAGHDHGRRIIPEGAKEIIDQLLALGHEAMGHPSQTATEENLRRVWWKGKRECIERHVGSCPLCQINQVPKAREWAGSMRLRLTQRPWQTVIVDYIDMPTSSEGHTAVLSITDTFTRWTEFILTKDKTAASAAAAFKENIILRHSLPLHVQTDGGTHFMQEFKELLDKWGINQHVGHAYHPQSPGQGGEGAQALAQVPARRHTAE
jgi:hypothetical protein